MITFQVGKKVFKHEFLVSLLGVDYSGILGVDALRRMEARVDLRTSTLVTGRTSFRLSGQEAACCDLLQHEPQAAGQAPRMGLITPEANEQNAPVGSPIPGLNPRGPDGSSWNVLTQGSVILPPGSQGLVIWKLAKQGAVDVPQEILIEPIGLGTPGAYVA